MSPGQRGCGQRHAGDDDKQVVLKYNVLLIDKSENKMFYIEEVRMQSQLPSPIGFGTQILQSIALKDDQFLTTSNTVIVFIA